MDNFFIIANSDKDPDRKITNEIAAYIEAHGKNCYIAQNDERGHIISETVPSDIECGIVLGGDGTLIRAAREMNEFDIPLLGINLGTLGYLTEVEIQDYKTVLNRLFSEKPQIEERMMLRGMLNQTISDIALNDIVVSRAGELRIVHFDIYVNGELFNSYSADGIIISAPTGSTGYNLSAGGPIVSPTAKLIVITPICPHVLNKSSIVLSADDIIDVVIGESRDGSNERAVVTFDGAIMVPLTTGNKVRIQQAEEVTKLIKVSNESFMKTMRNKMKGN